MTDISKIVSTMRNNKNKKHTIKRDDLLLYKISSSIDKTKIDIAKIKELEKLKGEPGETIIGPKGDKGDKGEPGRMPNHVWNGTKLKFENPDGTWDKEVDLQGMPGTKGGQAKGGGASHFRLLQDVPSSYSGQTGKGIRVKTTEDGLEFYTITAGGDALTTDPLSQFAATTSAQLAGVISDETGSGALVFGTQPTFTTDIKVPLIYGSIASGGDLLINSTSHATKGQVAIGSATTGFIYDETTNRVVVGDTETEITVAGVAVAAKFSVHAEGASANVAMMLERHSATAGLGAKIYGARSKGDETTPTVVASGDNLFDLVALGHDGTDYAEAARVNIEVDGTPGANDMPGRIIFLVSPDGSGTPEEAMRIASTKIVTFSGAVSLGTSNALTTGTIELGHASDTTISRSSAGVIAVEGVVIPSISSTNTFTNKRITKRTGTTTSSATPTINTNDVDFYSLTAQAVDITSFTTNLSGTPTEGQTLWIAITGTAARAITWGASFEASTVALPTTTVSTNRLDVGFVWNTVTSKWRVIATA